MSLTNRAIAELTADNTLKGQLLNEFAGLNQGARDQATLDLNVGALVAGETFSLGDKRFEWVDLSTAETATGSAAAAGTPNITLNVAPDRDFEVGEIFAIDTEYCKVTSHVAGSLIVGVERGYAGSTAAIQAADIILRSAAANVNGNLLIPVDDGTQAEAETKTITAVPALAPEYGARDGGTNAVIFDAAYSDGPPANSIVSANANTLSNFSGGYDTADGAKASFLVKGVTSTTFAVVLDATPVAAMATLFDDSAGLPLFTTTAVIAGNVVTVTEGIPVWENGVDSVLVEVWF